MDCSTQEAAAKTQEEWRAVAGFEGSYEASNLGRIRSVDRTTMGPKGPARLRGRVLKPSWVGGRFAYLAVVLYSSGKTTSKKVHALVAEAWIGPRPEGLQINHIDGDKANNAASNLEYITQSENLRHAWKMGLLVVKEGEEHHNAKLTEKDVREIRAMRGVTCREIGKIYGVSKTAIQAILNGKTWAHVEG